MAIANLRQLIREECASWSEDACIYGHPCKPLLGERCAYFEGAIGIGTGLYPEWLPGVIEYQQLVKQPTASDEVRRCQCGAILTPRRRFCNKCRVVRKRETIRDRVRRHRDTSSVTS